MTLPFVSRLTRPAQLAIGLLVALLCLAYAAFAVLNTPEPPASASGSESATGLTPPPKVLVFGDSYATGTGASSPDRGVVGLLADQTGWTISSQARGGTGYDAGVSSGGERACGQPRCPNFNRMLKRTVRELDRSGLRSDPDMVLVIGGRNDVGRDGEDVSEAIDEFYRSARDAFPDAEIFAVAPLGDDDPIPAELTGIRSEVKEAVEDVDGTYLDIGQPLDGKPELVDEDGVHPNDEGHEEILAALLPALREAGVSTAPPE